MARGCLTDIPLIASKERGLLLDCARELDELPPNPTQIVSGPSAIGGDRPGDEFNRRVTWDKILEPHGWRINYQRNGTVHWIRPAKKFGTSATTNHANSDLLYIFSTNAAPFDPETAYTKFSAFTLLNHSGDFAAAAAALAGEGFGKARHLTSVQSLRPKSNEETWPAPLDPAAFHGIAGDFVRWLEQDTEADPAALLIQFLTLAGNCIGRGPHFMAEGDRHGLNLFACLVGETAKGRKGTSFGRTSGIFKTVDPDWRENRIQFGLSSGEGLIWAVRDPISETKPLRSHGRFSGEYETLVTDHGISDKRLMIVESEFARVLRTMRRDGCILSPTLRAAWDSGDLRILTKNSPAVATGVHLSIIGHITREELLRHLNETESANGFANRFLWRCVRRAHILPEGGNPDEATRVELIQGLMEAVSKAQTLGEIRRNDKAREAWADVYPSLSEGKPGLLGAVIARAEAQTMRLSCLYAALNGSNQVRLEHLKAGLAVWDYSENSARYIFGEALGDPVADELFRLLRNSENGLARTQIRDAFSRHRSALEIAKGLTVLQAKGMIHKVVERTGGRPIEKWACGSS